jgi:hypothetical protein
MLMCRSLGIPIPKKGKKSVDFVADKVVLRILLDS